MESRASPRTIHENTLSVRMSPAICWLWNPADETRRKMVKESGFQKNLRHYFSADHPIKGKETLIIPGFLANPHKTSLSSLDSRGFFSVIYLFPMHRFLVLLLFL